MLATSYFLLHSILKAFNSLGYNRSILAVCCSLRRSASERDDDIIQHINSPPSIQRKNDPPLSLSMLILLNELKKEQEKLLSLSHTRTCLLTLLYSNKPILKNRRRNLSTPLQLRVCG